MKRPSSPIRLLLVTLALSLTFAGMFIPTANVPAPVSGLAELFGPPAPAQAAINYNRQAAVNWAANSRWPSRSDASYCSNFVAGAIKAGGFPLPQSYDYYIGNDRIITDLRGRNALRNGEIELISSDSANLAEVLEPGDFIFINITPYPYNTVYPNSTEALAALTNRLQGGYTTLGASHSVLVTSKGKYAQWNSVAWDQPISNLRHGRFFGWPALNMIGVRIKTTVPPGPPTITSPANNDEIYKQLQVQVRPGTLNHTNAYDFRLRVDNNADFSSPEIITPFQRSSTFTVSLPAEGVWHIQAQQGDTVSLASNWSSAVKIDYFAYSIDRTKAVEFAYNNNRRNGRTLDWWQEFRCRSSRYTDLEFCRQCATYVQRTLDAAGFPNMAEIAMGNHENFNVFSNNRNNSQNSSQLIEHMRQHPYIRSVDLNVVPSDLRPGDAIFYGIEKVGNGLGARHSVIVTDHVKADKTPLLAYWNSEKYAIFNPAPARGNTPQYLTHDFMRASGFNGDFIVVRFKGADIPRKVVPNMPTDATLVGTSLRINSPVADDWEYEISYSNDVVAEGLNQGNFSRTVAKGRVNASTRELNLSLPEGQYWLHVRHVRNGVASPWTVAKRVTVSRPPAPRLLAVANNATIIDTRRPTFRWTCSPLASRHEFTWWRSGGTYQTVTLGACTGTEMSYTPNVDMPVGGINWFVRAINGAGSAYSAYRWFEFRAPERATPIYPWGQWITSTRQPQMRFECGRHATSYVVQVRTDAGTPIHTQTLNPSWCSGGRLAFTPSIAFPNGNYVWSVTSVNAIGSVTSASANFRIMVQGIATPIITSPANLQTLTTSNVTFAVIGGLPTVRYQLMDMGGNVIWTKNGGTSLTETLPNGTYRVRAMNVLGSLTSDWSPVVMFSVSNPCNGIVDRGEIVAGVGVGVPPTCQIQRFSVRVPSTGRLFIDGQTSDTVVTDRFIMRLTTDPEGRNIVRDIRPASTGRAVFWHAPNWWGGLTPGQLYYFWLIPQPGVTVHRLGLNLYGNWPVITSSWVVELSSDHNWAATWWYNTSRSIIISRIAGDVEYTVYVRTNNGAKLIATANSVNGYVNIPVYLEGAPTIVEIRPRSGFGTYRMGLNGAPGLPLTAPSFTPR